MKYVKGGKLEFKFLISVFTNLETHKIHPLNLSSGVLFFQAGFLVCPRGFSEAKQKKGWEEKTRRTKEERDKKKEEEPKSEIVLSSRRPRSRKLVDASHLGLKGFSELISGLGHNKRPRCEGTRESTVRLRDLGCCV